MGRLQLSVNQILGIAAGCSILAAVLCNTALIPDAQSIAAVYRELPSEAAVSEASEVPTPDRMPVQAPEGSDMSNLVDINRASPKELETLPGVGPVLAERIIKYREQNGAFLSPEDLTQVKGIGEKTLEKLLPYITCG